MKMEPIVSSETSAIRTQTPGNYPKRNNLHKICVLILSTNSPETFTFRRRIQRDIIINVRMPSHKVLVILVRF